MRKLPLAIFCCLAMHPSGDACFIHSPLPVELIEDHITIDVQDQVATKEYTCTFYNPNQGSVEGGTCYMEVEPGAQVDKMTIEIEGRQLQGKILEADAARREFQEILARGGSPALLEFYGNGLIRAQVPRIPPMGKVTAVLRYTTYLQSDNGLFRMRVLNTNPKAWLKPLKRVTVKATIKTRDPIKSVYSPTHDIQVARHDAHRVTVSLDQENYLPRTPLSLYWHVAAGELGLGSIAYRDDEERGFFMLMLSPQLQAEPLPKQIVFCMDASGSMHKEGRFPQMKRGLQNCLDRLDRRDRFNIVTFGTDARSFEPRPIQATRENVERAKKYVGALHARGASEWEEALARALGQFGSSKEPKFVVALTDGGPALSEADLAQAVARIRGLNGSGARIFALGVGNEVNTKLLDLVCEDSGGHCDYVLPRESVEERLSDCFDRVSHPVMSDLALGFEDLKVEEVFPRRIPDLIRGRQIVVFGRYRVGESPAPGRVTLTGRVGDRIVRFEYALHLPASQLSHDFLPRVWAGRKIAHRIEEMKRHGPTKEVVEEIVRLAKQFGIVSPYTSYLVSEDIIDHGNSMAPGLMAQRVQGRYRDFAESNWAGDLAVEGARFERRLSWGEGLHALDELAVAASGRSAKEVMQKVRSIGPKTFYLSDGVWYDSAYDPELHPEPTRVVMGSDEFRQLLDRLPGIARYFSLTQVIVLYRGKVYRFEGGNRK